MKKKFYLKPGVEVLQFHPATILAGSLQSTANTQELVNETGPTEGENGTGNFTW